MIINMHNILYNIIMLLYFTTRDSCYIYITSHIKVHAASPLVHHFTEERDADYRVYIV